MKIAYKVWVEKDGQTVFGAGIFELLQLIRETGSLLRAAECLNMSYRGAWGKIRKFEAILHVELLEKGRHGKIGAHLTEAGITMLYHYEQIMREIDKLIVDDPIRTIIQQMNMAMKTQVKKQMPSTKNPIDKKEKKAGT